MFLPTLLCKKLKDSAVCSDVATKELILSLNAQRSDKKDKFLIYDLDEGHLFVKSEEVAWIQDQLKHYQKKITYEAPRREK